MNCLDYRRQLLADPLQRDQEIRGHHQVCTACAQWTQDLAARESFLREAIEVPIPDQLAERILLSTQLRRRHWQRYAIAASVVLSVTLGAIALHEREPERGSPFSTVALTHVLSEPHLLTRQDQIPYPRVARSLAAYRLAQRGDLGRVRYLDQCELPEGQGLHVILETPRYGLVSLIVSPSTASRVNESPTSRAGLNAETLDFDGVSVGVVAMSHQDMAPIKQWLRGVLRSARA